MSREPDGSTSQPFLFAQYMGFVPLLAGTIAFLGWRLTKHFAFPLFGALCLLFGLVMVCSGLISLGFEWRRRRNDSNLSSQRAFLTLALLLSNFPVAIYYTVEGAADLDMIFAD